MSAKLRCKNCILPQLPGFVGRAYCRFHWAGRLAFVEPNVPRDMYDEWCIAVEKQRLEDEPRKLRA